MIVTERRGFEPPEAFTSFVFKTNALNHSATFPIKVLSGLQNLNVLLYVDALPPEKQDLHW